MNPATATPKLTSGIRAFNILRKSVKLEKTADCNTALLFLTDGRMTVPEHVSETDVLTQVESQLADLKADLGHQTFLLTYTLSKNEQIDD